MVGACVGEHSPCEGCCVIDTGTTCGPLNGSRFSPPRREQTQTRAIAGLLVRVCICSAGLDPGLEGKVESSDDERVVIASANSRHEVSRSVAETVSVRADPAPPPRAAIPEQLVLSQDRYGR